MFILNYKNLNIDKRIMYHYAFERRLVEEINCQRISSELRKTYAQMVATFIEKKETNQPIAIFKLTQSVIEIYRLKRELKRYEEMTLKTPTIAFLHFFPVIVEVHEKVEKELADLIQPYIQDEPSMDEKTKNVYFDTIEAIFQCLIDKQTDTAESQWLFNVYQAIRNEHLPLPIFISRQFGTISVQLKRWLQQLDSLFESPSQRVISLNEDYANYCCSPQGEELKKKICYMAMKMTPSELLERQRELQNDYENSDLWNTVEYPCYDSEYTHCDNDLLTRNIIALVRHSHSHSQGNPLESYYRYRYSLYLLTYLGQKGKRPIPMPTLIELPVIEESTFSLQSKQSIVNDICSRIDNLNPKYLAQGWSLQDLKFIVNRLLLPHEDSSDFEIQFQNEFWQECSKTDSNISMRMGTSTINIRPVLKMMGSFALKTQSELLIDYPQCQLATDFLGSQHVLLCNQSKTKSKVVQAITDAQKGKYKSTAFWMSYHALRNALLKKVA